MSMMWIGLLIIFMVWISGKRSKLTSKNLIFLKDQGYVSRAFSQTYSSEELRRIGGHSTVSKHRIWLPNYESIRRIKQLKLNKRRVRLQPEVRQLMRKVNLNNLTELECNTEYHKVDRRLRIATVNARSVKGKIAEIQHNIIKRSLDIIIVTESWLTEKDEIWINAQGWNRLNYTVYSKPRPGPRRGGGLLLIVRSDFTVKETHIPSAPSYESCLWSIDMHAKKINILSVYHPPQSTNEYPDSIFIDQLCDHVHELLSSLQNVIVTGDFNIHVNDPSNNDAIMLLDAMSSLGFSQLSNKATHKSGNTLDLIFVEDLDQVFKHQVMDFLSDHRWVECELKINKKNVSNKSVTTRKLSEDHQQILEAHFANSSLLNEKNTIKLCEGYDQEMKELYNQIAPPSIMNRTDRKRVPWFTLEVKEQKKIVRNREMKWIKYQSDPLWAAYKRERNRYRNMLNYHRTNTISAEILKVKGDTKKLYQVVNEITNTTKHNPFPLGLTDQELADNFANFFLNKILKIREKFELINPYTCEGRQDIPVFRKFSVMKQDSIREIIADMKTKSCESDPIPTRIIKSNLKIFFTTSY